MESGTAKRVDDAVASRGRVRSTYRPATYPAATRLVRLSAMLAARAEGVSLADAERELGVSERTWQRYVAALRGVFGAALERDGQWLRLVPGWSVAFVGRTDA